MNTENQIEPVLIWSDDASIALGTQAAHNTLPFAQDVYDAWAAIPGLPEFAAQYYYDAIIDIVSLVESVTIEFYQDNFASKHQPLGFSQEKGMNLSSDKLPVFTAFIEKVNVLKNLGRRNGSNDPNIAPPEAFTVEDGAMIVDPVYIERLTAGSQLYLTTQTELDVKEAIENLVSSLNALNEVIPPAAFQLNNAGWGPVNLNQLTELIKVTIPNGKTTPDIEVENQFFFKLKQVVAKLQLP